MRCASVILAMVLAGSPALGVATASAQPATGATGHAEGPLRGEVSSAHHASPTHKTARRRLKRRAKTATTAKTATPKTSATRAPDASASVHGAAAGSVRTPGGMRPDDTNVGASALRGVSDGAAMKARGATPDENPGGPH